MQVALDLDDTDQRFVHYLLNTTMDEDPVSVLRSALELYAITVEKVLEHKPLNPSDMFERIIEVDA